jgi:hypothetical protein
MNEPTPDFNWEADDWSTASKEQQEKKLKAISEKTFSANNGPNKQEVRLEVHPLILKRDGPNMTIRYGFDAKITVETLDTYTFEKPEHQYPFRVLHTSASPFKNDRRMQRVLDDKSKPTAEEWVEEEGKRVLWSFSTHELPNEQPHLTAKFGRPVFHNHWAWIVIPKHPLSNEPT